jgi:plasmid maintenance system killer protein
LAQSKCHGYSVLINIAKLNESLKYNCYNAIIGIADDKQIEQLEEIQVFAKMQIEKLKALQAALVRGDLKRSPRQVFEHNKKYNIQAYSMSISDNTNTSVINIFTNMYKLAVNQKLRHEVYFKQEAKECMHTFLENSNDYERKLITRLLAQLSFNNEIAGDLGKDDRYMTEFNKILTIKPAEDAHLFTREAYNSCAQTMWNINEAKGGSTKPHSETSKGNENRGHVMISYNTGSRNLCLKMKSELETSGYKVWMDVSDIHGSSLDSMAKAVEGACVVLMCVTEKYRQSVNCQSEAQYAYKMGRPIIPCIMQKGYENVTGWLGIMMGDKIFINFMKYEFPECARRLKAEIDQHYKAAKQPVASTASQQPSDESSTPGSSSNTFTTPKKSSIQSWSAEKITEWFANKVNLHQGIIQYIAGCDGTDIHQIYVS